MIKLFLSSGLILLSITGFGQISKTVKIDSLVSVSLPTGYHQKDTLGQHISFGDGLVGFMEVIKAPNVKNTAPLKKEKDLNKVFKDYISTLQSQSANSITQHIRDTVIGTLKAKLFVLKKDDGNGTINFENYVLIYTTEATYTFEYMYPEFRKELINKEYTSYVNSIKFAPDLQRNDQYIFNTTAKSPGAIIAVSAGVILLVTVIIILVTRRRRQIALKR